MENYLAAYDAVSKMFNKPTKKDVDVWKMESYLAGVAIKCKIKYSPGTKYFVWKMEINPAGYVVVWKIKNMWPVILSCERCNYF